MFHSVPKSIREQMRRLEEIDARDRVDGTARLHRLRQISPDTGKFLAILAAGAPKGTFIEIGTSAGYSTLFFAIACREAGTNIVTFEVLEEKAALAQQTFDLAGVGDVVKLVEGDALLHLSEYNDIAFCFLDAEKEVYRDCYDVVLPRMQTGAILAADNVISHEHELRPFIRHVFSDDRTDALIVPIGKGILICRKN